MILSKSQLVNNITNEISDQARGEISPHDIRHNLIDIIDSVHNLTLESELKSINFSTSPSGNTRVGQSTIEYLNVPGANIQDNTAIGYLALKANYQGVQNTALGSNSLSCNVHGQGNVGLGYHALAGNTVGNLNIGLGNFALNKNKSGTGNIAIGHGAGYYVAKNDNYKFFLAYHPVNESHICSNPLGSGWVPLLYGDLSGIQLGVGTRSLHNFGTLQVSGNITPSRSGAFDLGYSIYPWRNIYLSSGIVFNNNVTLLREPSLAISLSGSFLPTISSNFSLGSSSRRWIVGYFDNIVVNNVASIGRLINVDTQTYSNQSFYLGVNSSNQPLFTDSGLDGGGIFLKSLTNNKEYSLTFRQPSEGMPCFNDQYNAVWYSNINFQVPSSRYIKTNSIVSYNASVFGESDCFGLFFNSGITYISRKNVLNVNPGSSSGHIAGVGNVNFVSNSGDVSDYVFSVSALESGVNVSQRFLSGSKVRLKDIANQEKDKLRGFELKYIDDTDLNIQGDLTDRFVIGSYNDTSKFVNGLVLMKDDNNGSVLSVTNIPSITENILPNTIFNVRSQIDSVGRFTSQNDGFKKSAIQLLAPLNCELSGAEIAYLNRSGVLDINMFKDSGRIIFARMKDSQQLGILSSGNTNAMITVGYSGGPSLPVISLKDNRFIDNVSISASNFYGKIYNLYTPKHFANQHNSLFYIDSSGNNFDLVVNKLDNLDARAVYTDPSGNTYAGYLSPSGRKDISRKTMYNTSYGYKSLFELFSGSGNIAIGYESLYNLTSGNDNITIGKNSGSGLKTTHRNIIFGNNSFNKDPQKSNTSGNIVIGHNIGNSESGSYQFLLGLDNQLLFNGTLGPNNSDKKLIMPSGGRLYINDSNDTESLHLKTNFIEIINSGTNLQYPSNDLRFRFTASGSSDLLILNHVKNPMSNSVSYFTPSDPSGRPFAELNGDLRLRGAIRFSDGTSLDTSSGIPYATRLAQSGVDLGNSGISIGNSGINLIRTLFIEGYMPNGLQAPTNGNKTSGVLLVKNNEWADSGSIFIFNRDTTSVIHSGAYVIAGLINREYRPIWISAVDTSCCCDP